MAGQSVIVVIENEIDWEELSRWDKEIPDDSPYKYMTTDEILDLFDDDGNLIEDEDVDCDENRSIDDFLDLFDDNGNLIESKEENESSICDKYLDILWERYGDSDVKCDLSVDEFLALYDDDGKEIVDKNVTEEEEADSEHELLKCDESEDESVGQKVDQQTLIDIADLILKEHKNSCENSFSVNDSSCE